MDAPSPLPRRSGSESATNDSAIASATSAEILHALRGFFLYQHTRWYIFAPRSKEKLQYFELLSPYFSGQRGFFDSRRRYMPRGKKTDSGTVSRATAAKPAAAAAQTAAAQPAASRRG